MRLLTISSETHREASKLFYATNTFSFRDTVTPEQFLAKVPADLLSSIKTVHLELHLEGNIWDQSSSTAKWRSCLADTIVEEYANIKSLHLTIYLSGFVTCWRNSQGQDVTSMFRSLRHLKQLWAFTVVILENLGDYYREPYCRQRVHEEEAHIFRMYEPHQEEYCRRKEIMRQWAEDIREVVLRKEKDNVEGAFEGLSLT